MIKYTTTSHLATVREAENFCLYLLQKNYKIDSTAEDWFHKVSRLNAVDRQILNRLCLEANTLLATKKETVESKMRKLRSRLVEQNITEHHRRTMRILRMNGML